MDARRENEPTPTKNRTTVERLSEREVVVTRMFNAPARIVFEAWTTPELFKQWWVPNVARFIFILPMATVPGRLRLPMYWPKAMRS